MIEVGKVVITGGTQGLGRSLSLAFGTAGYRVTAIYRSNEERARSIESEFVKLGIEGRAVRHDIAQAPFIDQDATVLIHNACGAFTPKPLHLIAWEEYEESFRTAVRGAYHLLIPNLSTLVKSKRGVFIGVLTTAAEGIPPKGFSSYSASKRALGGFTGSVAAEYGARGLRAFSVSPGFMDTALTRAWDPRLGAMMKGAVTSGPDVVAAHVLELLRDPLVGHGEDHRVIAARSEGHA